MSELNWKRVEHYREAVLGTPGDGVKFTLVCYPTCYRRGPWRLHVEVFGGPAHELWGCFDEQDDPVRNYHHEDCALREAQAIANVLWKDRNKTGVPIGSLHGD